MDSTIFLAQIWGVGLFAMGIGVFVSRKHYISVYRDIQKETLSVLLFAIVAISAGILQIQYHNVWGTFSEVVVSLLGWMLLAKGLAFAIVPSLVDRGGDFQVDSKLVPVSGAFMLILGAYLLWLGFFM